MGADDIGDRGLRRGLLLAVPATTNLSAWYAPEAFVITLVPIAIACWAFYTSLSGRVFAADLLS